MINVLKIISLTLILTGIFFNTSAKGKPHYEEIDEIKSLFKDLRQAKSDAKKNDINDYLTVYFIEFLEDSKSFDANFDSLNNYLSVLRSGDDLLQVFTWNIQYSDRSFKYFGLLQYYDEKKKNTRVYFLNDKKYKPLDDEEEENFDRKFNTNTEWFGALYYDLVTKKFNTKTYYTLIGWDGADLFINRKIVEVLHFDKHGLPIFGGKMFKMQKNIESRLVFEYAERVVMHLRYNSKHDIIVMDHLSPAEERYQNLPQYYGPDRSFDALKFAGGKWVLESNIDPDIAINYKRNPHIERLMRRGISDGF
jgi:hypothetical protein